MCPPLAFLFDRCWLFTWGIISEEGAQTGRAGAARKLHTTLTARTLTTSVKIPDICMLCVYARDCVSLSSLSVTGTRSCRAEKRRVRSMGEDPRRQNRAQTSGAQNNNNMSLPSFFPSSSSSFIGVVKLVSVYGPCDVLNVCMPCVHHITSYHRQKKRLRKRGVKKRDSS